MSNDRVDKAIFLLKDSGDLEKVPLREYDSEDLLQTLIEKHPELLAGDQISPESPVRWILVRREAGVPSGEDQGDRWSVDHLLLDQNGIPTFVETKRSSDTRIRREVVGQMLDYAANAQRYWPVDRIRSMAANQYGGPQSSDAAIMALLGLESPEEDLTGLDAYWEKVNDNLRDGRLRLLFVADRLPAELRRIIEFLNEQMEEAEILGIELAQYVGSDIRALVPRVVGQTEAIRDKKQRTTTKKETLTQEQFLSNCPPEAREFFKKAIEDSVARGMEPYWGSSGFSLRAPDSTGALKTLAYGFPSGGPRKTLALVQGYVGYIEDAGQREQVRQRLLGIPGTIVSGQYTVTLELTTVSVEHAKRFLQIVWEVASELGRGRNHP